MAEALVHGDPALQWAQPACLLLQASPMPKLARADGGLLRSTNGPSAVTGSGTM